MYPVKRLYYKMSSPLLIGESFFLIRSQLEYNGIIRTLFRYYPDSGTHLKP